MASLPRTITIQKNPYSLPESSFEVGLSEIAIRKKIGLLAYLLLGLELEGKYLGGRLL
jgi:aryl-alcohol dehydrogenase-like predicted oxidoreductase